MQIFRVKQVLASDGVEIKRQGFFLVLYNWQTGIPLEKWNEDTAINSPSPAIGVLITSLATARSLWYRHHLLLKSFPIHSPGNFGAGQSRGYIHLLTLRWMAPSISSPQYWTRLQIKISWEARKEGSKRPENLCCLLFRNTVQMTNTMPHYSLSALIVLNVRLMNFIFQLHWTSLYCKYPLCNIFSWLSCQKQ